jgi:hypothetical protein
MLPEAARQACRQSGSLEALAQVSRDLGLGEIIQR